MAADWQENDEILKEANHTAAALFFYRGGNVQACLKVKEHKETSTAL